MKFGNSIFKTFFLSLCIIANTSFVYAQTASILPPAKTTFNDQNGKPLTSGTVDFYVPGTTTRKTTWQDSSEGTPNTNPVILDGAGRALILGDGAYRQIVKDRNGNLIWDQVTSSLGSGSGSTTTVGDGLPVGTILPTSGLIAPANYQFAYGQTLSRSTFSNLLAAITITTPIGCVGGSATITLTDTTSLSVGTVLESICVSGSPTIISKTSTTVVLSSNATITVGTSGTFFPYGNGDGLTTFNVPDLRGYVTAGRCNMGGIDCANLNSTYFSSNSNNTPSGVYAKGGTQSKSLATTNLPPQTPAGTVASTLVNGGSTVYGFSVPGSVVGFGGVATGGAQVKITDNLFVTSSFTGTAFPGQTSAAFSIIPPTITLNYVIKVTPDSNLTSTFGVASIGGMTGVLACGSGVTCAGNTISITPSGVTSIQGMTGAITCGSGVTCSAGTISAPASQFISPLSYGAACDGVTNDTIAIQNALNAAAGKVLYFPAGTCIVSTTTLTIPGNILITGAGRNLSIIKTLSCVKLFTIDTVSNVTIENIWMQGSDACVGAATAYGAIFASNSTTQSNWTFRHLRQSGFNVNYWNYIYNPAAFSNLNIDDILIETTNSDTPSGANNPNIGIHLQSGAAGVRTENVSVSNLLINGSNLCFHIDLMGNFYKWTVRDSKFLSPGGSNVGSHCTNGLGATNAYAINVYDVYDDGHPPIDGIITGNYISNPIATGIYFVGGSPLTLAATSSPTLISNNEIVGQSHTDTLLPRGAIALNSSTDITVTGNKLRSNAIGINGTAQNSGTLSVLSNYCDSGAGGSICLNLQAGSNGSSNTDYRIVRGNSFNAGANSVVFVSAAGARFNALDLSGNTIIATGAGAGAGLSAGNIYATGMVTIKDNTFLGSSSTAMMNLTLSSANVAMMANSFNTPSGTGGILFANLISTTNGSQIFVQDATAGSSPCTSGGTGATAMRQNGAWKCF